MKSTRVLMLSRRSFDRRMYQGFFYELEDVIAEVASGHIAMPQGRQAGLGTRYVTSVLNKYRRAVGLIPDDDPDVAALPMEQNYDLFFYTCQRPHQLSLLRKLPDWKRRSGLRACYLTEVLENEFDHFRVELKALRQFDHIFLIDPNLVSKMQAVTGRPCHYLPVAVDALRFSCYRERVSRRIDCYSMGRRNEGIHNALLRYAQDSDFFYLHDTARFFDFTSYLEHRRMLARILRRSRYTLCERRDDNSNLLPRMFEAAAAGAVMLGNPPETAEFRHYFDWPDAMIPVPDPQRIVSQIQELDQQPQRLAALRAAGANQVLQRHDWVHRWKCALRLLGLDAGPGVAQREDRLLSTAAQIEEAEFASASEAETTQSLIARKDHS